MAPPDMKRNAAAEATEARMLRDMFKAVMPDLGVFKGAVKVVSFTGSLSLSLVFFGAVWYVSRQYDEVKEDKPSHHTPLQQPGEATKQ